MVTLKQRQYFELACPRCSSEDLVGTPDGRLHCSNCNRTDRPDDCSVLSVQTEIIEETETEVVALAGIVTLTPGHAYEIAETPMRCPKCGALGVEVASETIGACFACYSAIVIENCVLGCQDTEQAWVVIPVAGQPGMPVAQPAAV